MDHDDDPGQRVMMLRSASAEEHLGCLVRHWKRRFREEQSRSGRMERDLRARISELEGLLAERERGDSGVQGS